MEALVGSKLSAPGAADGVGAALDVIVASAGGGVAGDGVAAWSCCADVGVDAEGVVAGGVGVVAGADEGFDGPLWGGGCHH